jgi:hypothetical protein
LVDNSNFFIKTVRSSDKIDFPSKSVNVFIVIVLSFLIAGNVSQLKEVAGFPENVSAEKYFPFTTNFSLEHNAANFF